MTSVNEQVFDRARFAKAAFFGASTAVLRMYANKQIDAAKAMEYFQQLHTEALVDTKPAEALLKRIVTAFDDVPPV